MNSAVDHDRRTSLTRLMRDDRCQIPSGLGDEIAPKFQHETGGRGTFD